MTDYEVFRKWLDEILGVPSKVKHHLIKEFKGMYTNKKPKRARGPKGKYKGDDKSTPHINEAWVGGKAPKKGKKK